MVWHVVSLVFCSSDGSTPKSGLVWYNQSSISVWPSLQSRFVKNLNKVFLSFLINLADGLIETLDEWLSRAEGHKTLFKTASCTGPN